MTANLWAVIALPLAGAAVNHFFGRRMGGRRACGLAILAVAAAFAYAAAAALPFLAGGEKAEEAAAVVPLFDWIPSLGAAAELLWDPLAAVMTLVVTGWGRSSTSTRRATCATTRAWPASSPT